MMPHMRLRPAQSLIEILIAVAVFMIGMAALASLVMGGAVTQRDAAEHVKALAYAQEGIEALRSIRDHAWSGLTGGTHGIAVIGGVWGFSGTSDTQDGYTRTVSISTSTADLAYVTSTVTWPFTPTQIGTVTLSSLLTNWQKTIAVNWDNPVIAATTTLPTNITANAVAVAGNYLYVVTPVNPSGAEFFVYDLTTPTSPVLRGQLELGTTANMIDVSGGRAYVASDSNQHEVMIVDVASSTAPSLLGAVQLQGSVNINSVVASGTTIYIVRDKQGKQETFFVYDTTVPGSPNMLGSLYLGDAGKDVALVQRSTPYAFFSTAYSSGEFETVNISNPASMAVGGTYNAAGTESFNAVAVSGTQAYAGSLTRASNPEFFVLNTANPQSPSLLGSFEINANINQMRVRGLVPGAPSPQNSLVFLATTSSTGQFIVMDVSNPATPVVHSRLVLPGNATGLAITASTAYVTTDNPSAGLAILSAN